VTARCVESSATDKQSAKDPANGRSNEGVVMAVQHRSLPIMAVQFHPELILSLQGRADHQLVHNVVQYALAVYSLACHDHRGHSESLETAEQSQPTS